ncbi:hypothetical protein [Brochothrix thermosphacta]|uniref:hypothetical protein n=1 Tax=Brochothrix thermosphacta TaxID=2756 RepID=UPI003F954211
MLVDLKGVISLVLKMNSTIDEIKDWITEEDTLKIMLEMSLITFDEMISETINLKSKESSMSKETTESSNYINNNVRRTEGKHIRLIFNNRDGAIVKDKVNKTGYKDIEYKEVS